MKSLRSILLTTLALFFAGTLLSQSTSRWSTPFVALNAVAATGASTAYDTSVNTSLLFQVSSATTSTASVTFQQSIDGTHWYTSATVTNPGATGQLWQCPAARFGRINVATYSAGTITGTLATRTMDGDPVDRCKEIDNNPGATATPTPTATPTLTLTPTSTPTRTPTATPTP